MSWIFKPIYHLARALFKVERHVAAERADELDRLQAALAPDATVEDLIAADPELALIEIRKDACWVFGAQFADPKRETLGPFAIPRRESPEKLEVVGYRPECEATIERIRAQLQRRAERIGG